MMFDYKLIEAMAAVIREGGFERAARQLNITQSAVSQRIKLLEESTGQVLMRRTTPPETTRAGRQVLKHYQQVSSLEQDLLESLAQESDQQFTSLAVGINEDSLATWFLESIRPLLTGERITLDLRVDDQEQTLNYLKAGEVMGCISSHAQPVQGCNMVPLGIMRYRLVANDAFVTRWFQEGFTFEAAEEAPAIIFNRKDSLHYSALQEVFGVIPEKMPTYYVPSSEQFVAFICAGLAYGTVPDLQGMHLIKKGRLTELVPGVVFDLPLFWHVWNLRSRRLEQLTATLRDKASALLF